MIYDKFLTGMVVPHPPRQKRGRGAPKGLLADHCNKWIRENPGLSYQGMHPFREFIANYVGWHFAKIYTDTKETPWYVRPSAQKCIRLEAMKKVGIHVPLSLDVRGPFFKGAVLEAYTICLGLMSGCNIHSFQMEVKVPMIPHARRPAHFTKGHIDFLLTSGKRTWVMDVKGPSDVRWVKDTEDPWGYKKQLRSYMMSRELKSKVHGGALTYVGSNKFNEWKESLVPSPSKERKEEWYEWCDVLWRVKNEDHIPERPEWATTRIMQARVPEPHTLEVMEAIQCKLCSHREKCWGEGWVERESGSKTDIVRPVS